MTTYMENSDKTVAPSEELKKKEGKDTMSTIVENSEKTVDHPEEFRKSEGKGDDYELTLEGTKDNAKSESNHQSSDVIPVTGQSQTTLVDTKEIESQGECWGARHTLGFLLLLGISLMYAMRVNLSVAIVSMVKQKPKNITNTSDMSQVCLPPDGYDTSEQGNERGEFDWDEATQGQILGAFFYGYLVGNFFGGIAAEKFGGKLIFGWGGIFAGIFTLLSPLCAKVSTSLFITIRVFEGLCQGIMFPAINCLLAKWIPPVERTKFSSTVLSGAQVGTVVTMPISGWLCDTGLLGGWPSVFYVFGTLGIVWGIPWYYLVYSTPDLHPTISVAEKDFISKSCVYNNNKAIPIPWKAILTSTPFWAILAAHVGNNWGFFNLLTMLPTYLSNIQHFDMTSNGILSALPYLMMWIFSIFYGNFMSYLQANGKVSTITIRRMATAISLYGPMIALVVMCFVNCDQVLAMVVICISVALCGAAYSGIGCSHQDIAPNLGGTLMGFTSGIATIPGFLAPGITGLIINRNQTLSAWRTVFLISSALQLISGTIYIVFISAEIQPWNFPKIKNDDEAEEKEETRIKRPSTMT